MIKELLQKIMGIVTIGQLTTVPDDSGLDSIAQAEYDEKACSYIVVLPYGMSSNAPAGAEVLLLSIGGDAGNQAGIPYYNENRFRGLKEWEVKIGNFKTKANVFFNEDGQIVIEPKSGSETVLSGGDEPVIKQSFATSTYPAHTHATGFGPSGTVNEPVPSSDFNDRVLV